MSIPLSDLKVHQTRIATATDSCPHFVWWENGRESQPHPSCSRRGFFSKNVLCFSNVSLDPLKQFTVKERTFRTCAGKSRKSTTFCETDCAGRIQAHKFLFLSPIWAARKESPTKEVTVSWWKSLSVDRIFHLTEQPRNRKVSWHGYNQLFCVAERQERQFVRLNSWFVSFSDKISSSELLVFSMPTCFLPLKKMLRTQLLWLKAQKVT